MMGDHFYSTTNGEEGLKQNKEKQSAQSNVQEPCLCIAIAH
jgi:hypothetical protein